MEVRWACGWGCIAVAPGMHFWKHSLPVVCCSCSSVIVLPFKYSLVKNSAPRATGAALSCFYDFQGEQFEIELSSARRGYTFFGKLSRPRECFMCSTSIYVYTSRHTSPMHRDTCTECVCVFISEQRSSGIIRHIYSCQWPWMFWWTLPVLCITRRYVDIKKMYLSLPVA